MINNTIIYLLLFSLEIIWAQKAKGFPGLETDVYKIIPNTRQIDSLKYVGHSKADLEFALGVGNITRADANDGIDIGYKGLVLHYQDDYWDNYNRLTIQPLNDGTNTYVISKKFKLGIGRTIPKELLENYEYTVYSKTSNRRLSPIEDAALDKNAWRQYGFYIAIAVLDLSPSSDFPENGLSDDRLVLDVQNGKIIRIFIGSSQ